MTSISTQGVPDWISKRAGGRRRYNKQRQLAADLRRTRLARTIWEDQAHFLPFIHIGNRGRQRALARQFHVSESTISRDLKALFPETRCPVCDTRVSAAKLEAGWRRYWADRDATLIRLMEQAILDVAQEQRAQGT